VTEKVLDDCLQEELGEYQIIARRYDGWDAVVRVLLALDENHHDFLMRLLERLAAISHDYIDDLGGLYNVLTAEEMVESDAAAERADRRARVGFVAPTDATAFLGLATRENLDEIIAQNKRDPISRAYFREFDRKAARRTTKADEEGSEETSADLKAAAVRLLEAVEQHEHLGGDKRHSFLLAAHEKESAGDQMRFTAALVQLAHRNLELHEKRMEELAYLANLLVAGAQLQRRRFRSIEAARAVVAICNLGLDYLLSDNVGPVSGAKIAEHACSMLSNYSADILFRVGWNLLFRDVLRRTEKTILRLLDHAPADIALRCDLESLRRELKVASAHGAVWRVRDELDSLLGILDAEQIESLKGLLSQCPVLTALLLDNQGGAVKPSVAFIATISEIERVKRFLTQLSTG